MAKSRARDLAKEAAWRRRLARHADSGQTVRAWCRRHGVKEAAFHWWRRELARRDAEPASRARRDATRRSLVRRDAEARGCSFVPVQVTDDPVWDGDAQIEIELTDSRRIWITGVVNRQMLTDVLAVLISTGAVEAGGRAC